MIEFMKGDKDIANSLLKHCDLYSLMCTIFELLEYTYFADYNGNCNVAYQDLFYNKKDEILCPKADFFVTNDVVNQIILAQNNLLQQIQNNQNMQQYNYMNYFFQIQLMQLQAQQQLNMFSFSPILRWNSYLNKKQTKVNEGSYAFIINEIIQNLFITNFNIDSILGTACYKNLDNLYKKNY